MAKLPYMKWYPQDCDSDEVVKSMTDEEFGFYMRCLNHSWMNKGLPSDLNTLASVMGRSTKFVQRTWKKVGVKWQKDPENPGRFVNAKQEEMRGEATEKSEKARKAVISRYERSTDVERSYNERSENVTPRAYDSGSTSSVVNISSKKQEIGSKPKSDTSHRFEEWWDLWSSARGTNHQNQAAQAWLSVVTVDNVDDLFECTKSYIASRKGPGGYNPENFIFDQFRDCFRARWPPAEKDKRQSKHDEAMAMFDERMLMNFNADQPH